MATSNPCSRKSRRWASTHRFPAGPKRITFSTRRLRSWSTRSFDAVPYTLCGLATTVSQSRTRAGPRHGPPRPGADAPRPDPDPAVRLHAHALPGRPVRGAAADAEDGVERVRGRGPAGP